MANIYYLNPEENNMEDFNKNDSNFQIPSVAYVENLIKKLNDIIISLNSKEYNSEINTKESTDIVEFPINNKPVDNIDIESINTDSNHKFISNTQLNIFREKPSKFELETAINDLRSELQKYLNQYFVNLLNTKDALQKIKDISNIIKSDANLNTLINTVSDKVSYNEFKDHIDSTMHLNNNDRKALNLLIGFISQGCADWNATEEEPNYIRNKPESLPANGGNSDTVSGYSSEDLLNHQIEDLIIGSDDSYEKEKVDIFVNNSDITDIIKTIKDRTEGLFTFRSGVYIANILDLNMYSSSYGNIIIRGVGNRNTIFKSESATFNGRIFIEDLNFIKSNIHIGSYCTFDNVVFTNCKVYIDCSNESTIRNCVFDNCQVIFNGACTNNMIINNRFIRSGNVQYIGGSNMISNNLIY